ncbi:MAG: MFS transporter [Anaerolineae bacterium]|nr:MFS transporter [Anaerolineae bacterium]
MRRTPGYTRAALIYACGFGAMALFFPYINQHLLRLGYSGTQIGSLAAIASLTGLVLAPVLSSLADRTGQHRRILMLVVAVEGLALLGLGLTASVVIVGLMVITVRTVLGLDISLRDRMALHWLKEHGSDAYGSLRIWGSLGYAVLVFAGGAVAGSIGAMPLFVVGAALMAVIIVLARVFAERVPTQEQASFVVTSGTGWRAWLHRPPSLSAVMWVILLTSILAAVGQSAMMDWAYTFIEFDLGGGKSGVGLFSGLAALAEMPLMLFADRLMRQRGAAGVWVSGMVLLGLVIMVLSLVQTAWQAVPLALLMGTAQGFRLVAPIVYVGQVSQPHRLALNLTLVTVVTGLSSTVASPLLGYLYDTVGIRPVLQVGAGMLLLAGVVLVVGGYVLRRRTAPHVHDLSRSDPAQS